MFPSLLRFLPWYGRWKPLTFSNLNVPRIPLAQKIEEEAIPGYVAARYYPVRIGEVFNERYQVVGKLGYGGTSTVWLARDMNRCNYVTLKIFITSTSMGQQLDGELNMYKRLERGSKSHPGRKAVRMLLDSFDVHGPTDKHSHGNPLKYLFLALDYLHSECKIIHCDIIHCDIKSDNIMLGIADDSVFTHFEESELQTPSSRKELDDGRIIYESRQLRMPKHFAPPVLCDFGSAMSGDVDEHLEDIQPNFYRAPQVILEIPWSYSVDIWNTGCVAWDMFEGEFLFTGHDPELQTYRSRAHLAEMISLLGPPPSSLLAQGRLTSKFFSEKGEFCAGIPLQHPVPLEDRETTLKEQQEDREKFLCLMRKMVQWEPGKQTSATELVQDEWIQARS